MYDLILLFIGSENLISLKRILGENQKLYNVINKRGIKSYNVAKTKSTFS